MKFSQRGPRRLGALTAAGIAAVCMTALSGAPATAASGPQWISSGAFSGYVLCASPNTEFVYMAPTSAATGNTYCQWLQFGPNTQFTLYNLGKNQVMAYTDGNEGLVVMENNGTSKNPNKELWSWGGQEGWGAAALQSFYDSGQNVDAKAPAGDYPRTDPVRTRGWRHGHQRELTWNEVTPS
ncbi:hypothetical protein [Streptomyces katrae]|uniref:hypothetical protein n=1 Tax=Streptomyces katrae TaxID=68223 RepID=UPI000AA63805|nr:hypothetical protein [Streptomyces katrae]